MAEEKLRPENGRRTRYRKPWFTDAQIQIIAASVVAIVVGLSQAISVYLSSRSNITATEIKEELKINNQGLGSKLDNIERTSDMTHSIVNSGSVAQDKLLMIATKQLSAMTDDPQDDVQAEVAEAEYKKNVEKQKSIDAKAFPKEKQP